MPRYEYRLLTMLTRDITPHDRLEWYDVCFLHKDGAAF